MKYIYLILFLGFSCIAIAQGGKDIEGTPEIAQERVIKFYPNPATTVINFEFFKKADKNLTLQIYNFVGKKVFEANDIDQKTTIALNDFFRGVYIFQLRDKAGKIVESGKFQVNK
jgi:hypothetical protein